MNIRFLYNIHPEYIYIYIYIWKSSIANQVFPCESGDKGESDCVPGCPHSNNENESSCTIHDE